MKKFNLSEIMKKAHNLYKNCPSKYPTFAEALCKSWKMAKFNVQVTESIKAIEVEKKAIETKKQVEIEEARVHSILFIAEMEAQRIKITAEAKAQLKRDEIAARKAGISYSEYQNQINRVYGYGCGAYCGD